MVILKYAQGDKISNRIDNLYDVCMWQAQKSIKWKYINGYYIIKYILERDENRTKRQKSSRILKGNTKDMIKLREEASYNKEIHYHVVIIQAGMSNTKCSDDMKVLLRKTVQVLVEMVNMDCRVICSE